jgi:hypothetical protein
MIENLLRKTLVEKSEMLNKLKTLVVKSLSV